MATKKTADKSITANAEIVEILEVSRGQIECCLLGATPYICNRMSEKGARELLIPRGRKTSAEKATTLKHDPRLEYRSSPYLVSDPAFPTYIGILATSFKKAMMTAALDIPGAKKAQIARLVHVRAETANQLIPLYGVPELHMATVRSADMNRTPDIRTRATLPKWACKVTITYAVPMLRPQAIANLLAAAGQMSGVGDWRGEKGSGNFGEFAIVGPDNPEFLAVMQAGGREAQQAAIEAPKCFDDETQDLLDYYDGELKSRELRGKVAAV